VTDVVVIGAGPNGLVAANLVADAGLEVVVCEEQPEPGGAVRSAQLTLPGYVHDLCSAFYPFGVASPAIQRLELEQWGLRWRHAPLVVAHPTPGGPTAVLSRDLEETASSLDEFALGDGETWKRLYRFWSRIEEPFMDALTTPFPPILAAAQLAAQLRGWGLLQLARLGVMPVRRFAQENFRGAGGPLLLGGNALHADLTPETPGSAIFGLILCGIGQHLGFPVPEGGAGRLTDALISRLKARGGAVLCGRRVERIQVHGGRASGVALGGGETLPASTAVLADVGAPQLYGELLAPADVPAGVSRRLQRFQYDNSTIKVDWALSAPIPWSSGAIRRAGTVHVSDSVDQLSDATHALERQIIPGRPFLVLGQYAMADPTRAPDGSETAWAYSHVPQQTLADEGGELRGVWDEHELAIFARRMEDEIERLAPGFTSLIIGRSIMGPHELEHHNRNLVGGAINGGTTALHQQLIFRPTPGLGRPETPIAGLYLASSSAHPGGAVHGACGANAAQAALYAHRTRTQRLAAATARFAIGP
jgi:phytoene dehydrogenase-like protein